MSNEFIHDPEGIVLFEEPTDVEVTSGAASSTATVRVLPFSARRSDDTFWAGPDTYRVPEDADFTIVEDLNLADSDVDPHAEGDESVSLSALVGSA